MLWYKASHTWAAKIEAAEIIEISALQHDAARLKRRENVPRNVPRALWVRITKSHSYSISLLEEASKPSRTAEVSKPWSFPTQSTNGNRFLTTK